MKNRLALEGLALFKETGWEPRKAPMRSSSYRTFRDCPFRFLLKERLGIRKPYRTPPPALWLGTCAHICWEAMMRGLSGLDYTEAVRGGLVREMADIESALAESGQRALDVDEKARLIEDFETALVWVETTWELQAVNFEKYRPMLVEEEITVTPKSSVFTSEIIIKVDSFLFDRARNEVWGLDMKTTSYPTGVYLESRRFAIQPKLYRLAIHLLLQDPVWRETLGIGDAKFAGFIHYAIAKPSIRVSKKTEKKDGREAAVTEYRERTREWYRGIGEFKAKGEQRGLTNRTVAIQFQRFRNQEPLTAAEYEHMRHYDLACNRPIQMKDFPPNGDRLLPMFPSENAELDPYWPFYDYASDAGMKKWPELAAEHGFIRSFREDGDEGGISV